MISCTIDIRVPVTFKEEDIRSMCEGKLEDENGRIEINSIGNPLFFPRESPLVEALYKAYVDVTGDTENEPMVIGGGTYAKTLKNIIWTGKTRSRLSYPWFRRIYSCIRDGRSCSDLYGSNQESSCYIECKNIIIKSGSSVRRVLLILLFHRKFHFQCY